MSDDRDEGVFEDTVAAASQTSTPRRSPSEQRLHDQVHGRLFDSSNEVPAFESGTSVAGRYRIVGLLGRGGMGEVFRARDLVLDQDVAIKFLPAGRSHDDAFMRRFVNEVRLARQISHPSVCRVHDIGEVDGRPFLSMEYIDGEDLASLLRRIGRLPPEKGYELAQQLCAGLAELHDAGLLHRDLKPANVMIDGKGRLKIADFGLAAVSDELRVHEYGDGTPAYMAPEQLEGREVSKRSDIYSLGVVLYELLSGRHPQEAVGGPSGERGSIDRRNAPVALRTRVTGLTDETLDVVERCLQSDPQRRPASVLDVAAALPGGDPIAAALRAGRAPSVDAVANAKTSSRLRPWQAWTLALFTMGVLVAWSVLGPVTTVWGQSGPQLAPAVLEDRARTVVEQLGGQVPEGAEMSRFFYDAAYTSDWPHAAISDDGAVPVLFEYRASPKRLARLGPVVSSSDPPMQDPGEVRVVLDVRGRLRTFERIPREGTGPGEFTSWAEVIESAGFESVEPTTPHRVPPHGSDARVAWTATTRGDERAEIEGALWNGQPVWFDVASPWTSVDATEEDISTSLTIASALVLAFLSALAFGARNMIRRGDTDLRGGVRVALTLTACVTLAALLVTPVGHSNSAQTVLRSLSSGLLSGGLAFLSYSIVEPFSRRFLPGTMVSWARLVRGRWHDEMVGRDVLIGAAVGSAVSLTVILRFFYGGTDAPSAGVSLESMGGIAPALGVVARSVSAGAMSVLQVYVLFLAVRWVLRKTWIAAGVLVVVWTLLVVGESATGGDASMEVAFNLVIALFIAGCVAYLVVRQGALAFSATQFVLILFTTMPLTSELSGWYGIPTLVVGTVVCLVLMWALRAALVGRAASPT